MALLTLGGFTFQNFAVPEFIRAGGPQRVNVHRMIGGGRQIDILGRDDDAVSWGGQFISATAEADCLTVDAMRIAGNVYQLTYGNVQYPVVITKFTYDYRRTNWVEYKIECTIVINAPNAAPAGGAVAPAADLGAAGNAGAPAGGGNLG